MIIQLAHTYEDIISIENLLEAWSEFVRGKREKQDVMEFSFRLMDNIFSLRHNLKNFTYRHGAYQSFHIFDPKPRHIHKATVRDRLVHHAIYRKLYLFFARTFIADSFSCQLGKGTHRALNRFTSLGDWISKNSTKTVWVLKCDIKKFFTNIDHDILTSILQRYIPDSNILWLLQKVIESFQSHRLGVGLPLGNLTSQLFVNIYMNEFDQFVKHRLKARYYIRYADDFVIFSRDRMWLDHQIPRIRDFLRTQLRLELHPEKVFIKTLASGVDFLGWAHFSDHRVLRTTTRRRMMKKISLNPSPETITSYLGLLRHGNTYKIKKVVLQSLVL